MYICREKLASFTTIAVLLPVDLTISQAFYSDVKLNLSIQKNTIILMTYTILYEF